MVGFGNSGVRWVSFDPVDKGARLVTLPDATDCVDADEAVDAGVETTLNLVDETVAVVVVNLDGANASFIISEAD